MKRCTLFLSTAGGSSPYGTFTNITTDHTSGVQRQIWHTYLNEQQGSPGSLGLCGEPLRRGEPQLHYSAKTHSTFIIHFIAARARSSFAQGQQKAKRRFSFFFFSWEINVPDKWGFYPLGLWSTNKHQIVLKTRVNVCMGFKQPEIWLWVGEAQWIFL